MLKKPNVFILLISLIFITISTNSYSASYDPSIKYRTIKTDHFAIHYPANIEEEAQRVALVAEDVHNALSPKYKWTPWGRTNVLLVDSSDIANGMASVLPYNWIYIRITGAEADSSLNNYDDWLRMLITHEYTHIMQFDKYRGAWLPFRIVFGKLISPNGVLPGWYKEGQAIYEETVETGGGRIRGSFSDMVIRTAILQDDFLPIDQVVGIRWQWPGSYTHYIYGAKFLQYLAETYGEDKLYEFIENVASSPLLFMANRQAKKTFSEMEFETEKVHNRYAKQKKEGAPTSKSFYKIWKEWKESLKKEYAVVKEKVDVEGLTPFEMVVKSKKGFLTSPAVSPDGQTVAYTEITPYGPPSLRIIDINGQNGRMLKKDVDASQISFSHDGKFIVYSKAGKYKKYGFYYDLYKYDFETKKLDQLTKGKRARDPDVSPDGKEIVCVTQDAGTSIVSLYNFETKELTPLPIDAVQFTQYSNPRFSPDGSKIAVAVAIPGSIWDIYLFDRKGKKIARVTDGFAVDDDPVWSPDGKSIYFISDRSGISNIYRYELGSRKLERVTNVLTGVFDPAITPDGKTIVAKYYNGAGYDIRKYQLEGISYQMPSKKAGLELVGTGDEKSGKKIGPGEKLVDGSADQSSIFESKGTRPKFSSMPYADTPAAEGLGFQSKKYSPFSKSLFLPRFIMPNAAYIGDAFLFSGMTGGADPLRWHSWVGGVTYRTDSQHFGYFFNYWYNRFLPMLDMGMISYSVDFGTFTYANNVRSFHLYEKRLRGYAGLSIPVDRHVFGLRYYYEDRQPTHVALTTAEKNYFNFGVFAGFNALYGYNDSKEYQASISREGGRHIRLGFEVTNSIFGSSQRNEQYIFAGDWREFIGLWGLHVLALRAAGGMVWGDELRQGTFSMGGDLGEGKLAGGGSLYYFPLRGLPIASLSRNRAMLMSAEYRFPLISAQRGLGTMPIYLREIHLAAFADYGNSWDADQDTGKYFFSKFYLGTGLELRGDFTLGYELPVTGRIGYGIIVVGRDRLGNLKDRILGQSARKGLLVLQIGTSF